MTTQQPIAFSAPADRPPVHGMTDAALTAEAEELAAWWTDVYQAQIEAGRDGRPATPESMTALARLGVAVDRRQHALVAEQSARARVRFDAGVPDDVRALALTLRRAYHLAATGRPTAVVAWADLADDEACGWAAAALTARSIR